jgi:hypothetical protein
MTQARIGIGYSDEEWHPAVRRCRQALHQDPEFFGGSFGRIASGRGDFAQGPPAIAQSSSCSALRSADDFLATVLDVKRRVVDLLEFLKSSRLRRYAFEPYKTPAEGSGKLALACPLLSKEIAVRN